MSDSVKDGSSSSDDLYASWAESLALRPDRLFPPMAGVFDGFWDEGIPWNP